MSVKVKNLSFEIENKRILNNISFEINSGEIIAILGPNGSGKSTLINIISGNLKKTSGEIMFNGTNLEKLSIEKQALIRSTMSQNQKILYDFKSEEIIELGWIQFNNSNFRNALKKVSIECGIANLLDKNFSSISGGEQQRIHFARTLIQLYNEYIDEKRYYLFDEPTSNLDLTHEISLIKILKEKVKENFGILIALHDLNLAYNFADKILLLKNGELAKYGTPNDVFIEENLSYVYEIPIVVNKKEKIIKYY